MAAFRLHIWQKGMFINPNFSYKINTKKRAKNTSIHSKTIDDAPQRTGLQRDRSVEEEVESNGTPEIMINCLYFVNSAKHLRDNSSVQFFYIKQSRHENFKKKWSGM